MGNPLGDPDLRTSFSTLQRRVKELERRRTTGRPSAAVRLLDDLDDVDVAGAADGDRLTYDATEEMWVRGADTTPSTPFIEPDPMWTDTGTIEFSTTADVFNYQHNVTVHPMSIYVVTVTGRVIDSRQVKACDDPVIWIPATWKLTAYDATADPDGDYEAGNMGSGAGLAQCTVLCANDTEEDVYHNIYADLWPIAGPLAGFEDWDSAADVEITIRQEYYF